MPKSARVAETVREPMLGAIRLEWWRETAEGAAKGAPRNHDVARGLAALFAERRCLQMRLRAMGVYSTDAHANFVYLPGADVSWPEVFGGTGLQVRHYGGGGVRITIGSRASTRAVVRAVGAAMR